jgi:integrase
MRLDTKTVAQLTLPAGKTEQIYWDSELRGFGYRLRQRGGRLHRTWVAQYRAAGHTRRSTLGAAETLLPIEARTAARRVLARAALGDDPQSEKAAKRAAATRTFRAVVASYLEARGRELRPTSHRIARIYLTGSYFKPLHSAAVSEIAYPDIAACLRAIEHEHSSITAAAARRAVSTLFAWAIAEGLMGRSPVNPVIGTRKPLDAKPRERVLSNAELIAIWKASDSEDDYGRIIRLLMLTGKRAAEIGGICWSEVNLDSGTWHLPAARSKNKRTHSIVLPAPALDIIRNVPQQRGRDCLFGSRSDSGYTSWENGKRVLDLRLGDSVQEWRPHDIRRSVATHLGDDLGCAPHVIEGVLGHYRQNVATTYNRSRYDREVTAALARWAAYLTDLVEGRDGKVIALHG